MQVEENMVFPMVVTPAPSSPESPEVSSQQQQQRHPDLDRLWHGRVATRRWTAARVIAQHANTPTYHDVTTGSPAQTIRLRGMIQDMGESEYLPVDDDHNHFVERLPLRVVTDYADWHDTSSSSSQEEDLPKESKRPRREKSSSSRHTTFLVYMYFPSAKDDDDDDDEAETMREELRLHQLVEWIGVVDDVAEGDDDDMMVDVTSPGWSSENEWSWAGSRRSPWCDWRLPRLHATGYALRDLDDAHLRDMPSTASEPLMETSEAVAVLAQALRVSHAVAETLWLTLLSRAEPSRRRRDVDDDSLLGCASLEFVVPDDDATVSRWMHTLTTALRSAVPVWRTWWDDSSSSRVLEQRHGRIRRHPWQLPAGATVLVRNDDTTSSSSSTWARTALPSLVQRHRMPLRCEGCHQVSLPADWRVLVVSTPSTRLAKNVATVTVDLRAPEGGRTPPAGDDGPSPPSVRWARTLASRRAAVPSVTLSRDVRERAPSDFCRLRRDARDGDAVGGMPDEAAFARWLTWTRLWARSRGDDTASLEDWDRALRLDRTLASSSSAV